MGALLKTHGEVKILQTQVHTLEERLEQTCALLQELLIENSFDNEPLANMGRLFEQAEKIFAPTSESN
jgi:hypothetical protein